MESSLGIVYTCS